ncbi:MAG: hypothetical protein M3R38_16720 [Actinomycetota bacterium]|nr:hypothetical protein [Actinomycetota bacterium]
MGGGRPIRRGKLRLARRAVHLWQAGASVGEVSRCLKCPKERVAKILAPIKRGSAA